MRDEDEFLQLGPEEYFDSDGITVIEWADRVAGCLPRQYVRVTITLTGDESREFEIAAIGERFHPLMEALASRLAS